MRFLANLSAFRTFVRFVLVWICRFPLPLGVWEGLRFVIVALPGLFSYFFFLHFRRDGPKIMASIKYLVVTITRDLRLNTHIRNMCTEANRTLGFLRRNLHQYPQDVKEAAYKEPVHPVLEYGISPPPPHPPQLDAVETNHHSLTFQTRTARTDSYKFLI